MCPALLGLARTWHAIWMQTTGALLLGVQGCSSIRLRTAAHDGRRAHGLLYLAAAARKRPGFRILEPGTSPRSPPCHRPCVAVSNLTSQQCDLSTASLSWRQLGGAAEHERLQIRRELPSLTVLC